MIEVSHTPGLLLKFCFILLKESNPSLFFLKKAILYYMFSSILIVLVSIFGLGLSVFYLKKNLIRIALKNKSIDKPAQKVLNYPLTLLWYGYLIAFFIGLTLNNLVFK